LITLQQAIASSILFLLYLQVTEKLYMAWRRFNGDRIEGSILDAVRNTVEREIADGYRLKVCIGTDSQVRGTTTEYATVIVFLREKKGGFMFIHNEKSEKVITLRERMITEVWKSVDVAYKLCDLLDEYDIGLEVHADINTDPHFKSNEALREAMGYILGMGFVFKAKPDAFASSYCADKVV
jgi:predicted RNase H-related nuclease YkuK (DUF458 family)